MEPTDARPLISVSLLRDARDGCGLRIQKRWERASSIRIPFGPARLRDALVDQLRVQHLSLPHARVDLLRAPEALTPEEQRVFWHAAGRYAALFAEAPVTHWDVDLDRATVLRKRDVELLNPIDLTLRGADGMREIRLLSFGTTTLLPDPLDDDRVRMTILRVAVVDGADAPLRVTTADLINADCQTIECTPSDLLPDLRTWLDDGIAAVTARTAEPERGTECTRCQFIHTCPAHPGRAGGVMRRHDYLPPLIGFTPTSYDTWRRCPQQFKLAKLLKLPASDASGSPDEGILVHRILEAIHDLGDCHDDAVVDEVLNGWGLATDQRTRGFVDRHRVRCPGPASALGHEYAEARFHRLPLPNFVAAARYDAIWMHDDRLDVRDYKTGSTSLSRVGDDPRARLQAWILAPLAESLDLELSVRFEMLAPEIDEDPEAFTPDDADLGAITEELREAADAILSDAFPPTTDPITCSYCSYRSICHASHAPGTPMWPIIDASGPDPVEP
jgi:RecB family exonuclease